MIKLIKLPEPDILKDNKEKWTKEYLQLIENDEEIPATIKNRYNRPEIKNQLILETHGKCAYCESKIPHISYGDIEHILPKNKNARPDLYVEWSNLTYSCEACNRTRKKDYYSEEEPLINPYLDNIDEFFIALGGFIYHKPGNRRGEITERILELNRVELLERRKERLEKIIPLVDQWANEQNPILKEILEDQIKQEASEEKEYSFVIKTYLNQIGLAI